ncbi:MAG: branched-chain amino acid ABC transporter permease [Syntrophobacteraceae bacterium]|nr:branched-chain amino acid ABC transporter permease [Syntrophobacteraceae bacterium]
MLKRFFPSLTVVLVIAALFLFLPRFYNNQSFLFNMMLYLALAEGLNIIYGFTGYLPFGYVGFFGAGAYGAAIAITLLHISPFLAVIIGGFCAVLTGVILIPLLRLSGAYFAIANLAASQALYQVVANPSLEKITQGPYGIDLSAVYNANAGYYTMLGVLIFAMLLVAYMRNSDFGLSLLAIKEDQVSASLAGVNVVKARSIAWMLSAFVAGLCGAAFGWYTAVFYPSTVFSLDVSVFTIVFVLFGGIATVAGPLIGALLLYSMYNFIGISTPQYFQLFYGLLIIVLVLFLPDGIASILRKGKVYVP